MYVQTAIHMVSPMYLPVTHDTQLIVNYPGLSPQLGLFLVHQQGLLLGGLTLFHLGFRPA